MPIASPWTTIKKVECVQACSMAMLCSQSYQGFLRVSVVEWGSTQGQIERERDRREQSQKEIELARIQVGGGRGTRGNTNYWGCTVPGGLMIDKDMLV